VQLFDDWALEKMAAAKTANIETKSHLQGWADVFILPFDFLGLRGSTFGDIAIKISRFGQRKLIGI